MNKPIVDSSRMPGYPKPRPEQPKHHAPARPTPPVAPVRTRLGWSRTILDQAWEPVPHMEGLAQVPPVRSMAALRARAGEAYRPLRQVEAAQPAPVPESVVVPVPQKAAPVAIAPEPEWERPIQPLRPPFFRSAWETVLRYLPRLPQISE